MSIIYFEHDFKEALKDSIEMLLFPELMIQNVCIDSRLVLRNSLFFAIPGQNYDGHDFCNDVIDRSATCIVVERISETLRQRCKDLKVSFILVRDSVRALGELARYRRSQINAKVIAVTGSIGKTTVKSTIAAVLDRFSDIEASEKSFNNHIGMPLTLANVKNDTKVVVLEIGMNHIGEIEYLSKIAMPHISIITMITNAHIGNFNNIDEIVRAKCEIFSGMNSSGIIILNKTDPHCEAIVKSAKECGIKNIFYVGSQNDSHMYILNHRFTNICTIEYNIALRDQTDKMIGCSINGLGYHSAFNTLFTFAVARIFKLDLTIVAEIVSKISTIEGRGNIGMIQINDKKITVINDSYNSSPDALKSAIVMLGTLKKQNPNQRAVCFLGDMLELGSFSEECHKSILNTILESEIDVVYTVGKEMRYLYEVLPIGIRGHHFQNSFALANKIKRLVENGDLTIFKASRSININLAIDRLYHS